MAVDASSDRNEAAQVRRLDFAARCEILARLAPQADVRTRCFDEEFRSCALAPQVLALGLDTTDDGRAGSAPLSLIRASDHLAAMDAVIRARSYGAADAVVHPVGSDEEMVLHIVDMLAEWGVLVSLLGGARRPLTEHHAVRSERRLSPRLVHHRDRSGRITWVDDATEELLGWSPPEMVGRSTLHFVDPADHDRAIRAWVDMLAGQLDRSRIRYLTSTGARRWLEARLTDRPDEGHVEVELIDVHDEMVALSAAKFGEAQFDALTESLPVGVIQVTADGEVRYVNRWMRDLLGVVDRGVISRDAIVVDDRDAVDRAFAAALENGDASNVDARLITAPDGHLRHCRLRIRPLGLDEDGRSQGAIASVEDVTETLALHARLHAQIRTDALTGIPNRLALNEWLVEHLVASTERGVTLLYFDLDGFKHVNDRLGHEAGDRLLRAVAHAVDTVIEPRDIVARIGGDEFVVATPQLLDDEGCALLARRLLDAAAHEVDLAGETVTIGCSIGIARTNTPGGGPAVLSDADHAMYDAKRSGGRRWTVYTEALRTDTDSTLDVQ